MKKDIEDKRISKSPNREYTYNQFNTTRTPTIIK